MNKVIEKLITKFSGHHHPQNVFSSHNEWLLYTNLLLILHLFAYCFEPYNRVKDDPGDKKVDNFFSGHTIKCTLGIARRTSYKKNVLKNKSKKNIFWVIFDPLSEMQGLIKY
jgi:hypothetical protein